MTNEQIKDMIEKYAIIDNGDGRLRINNSRIVTPTVMEQLKAAKPAILFYLAEKRAAHERRCETFESITGVRELRAVREEWAQYRTAFNRAIEQGDSVFPPLPAVREEDVESQYPAAVFALEVEHRKGGANYELAKIATIAYNALCDGDPWEDVKSTYDAATKHFVSHRIWD